MNAACRVPPRYAVWAVSQPDLGIQISDDADPVVAGNQLTYTITVENDGGRPADNVRVTQTLPPGVTFVSTSGCTNDPNGEPTCNLGTINDRHGRSADSAGYTDLLVALKKCVVEAAVGVHFTLQDVVADTPPAQVEDRSGQRRDPRLQRTLGR